MLRPRTKGGSLAAEASSDQRCGTGQGKVTDETLSQLAPEAADAFVLRPMEEDPSHGPLPWTLVRHAHVSRDLTIQCHVPRVMRR